MAIIVKWALTGAALLICGCVNLKTQSLARSTIVLAVQIDHGPGAQIPVNGLILNIEGETRNPGGQFAFPASPTGTLSSSEFLVRVELSPGHYRLSRLSGVTRGGVDELRFDTEVDMRFEARGGAAQYLGRIVLSGTDVKVIDSYKEDRVKLVRNWSSLRSKAIQHRQLPTIARVTPPPPPKAVAQGQGAHVPPDRLDLTAEKLLPAKARPAFRSFLKSRSPRAFAVAASGGFGSATGGTDVVARALRECKRASAAKRDCALFALDDTLVTSIDWSGKSSGAKTD